MFEPRAALQQGIAKATQAAMGDNWDGEGGLAVDPLAVTYAQEFARALPLEVTSPEVWVDGDGEVAFDWQTSVNQVFSVRVAKDGTLTYAGLFGVAKLHGVEVFQQVIPAPILEGIRRASESATDTFRRDAELPELPEAYLGCQKR